MEHRRMIKSLARLMALVMIFSLFSGAAVSAATGTLTRNTESRHVLCQALSSQAQAYYTGSYTYEELSKLSGVYSPNDSWAATRNNPLYTALQTLMSDTHTVYARYNPSGETKDELSYLWDYTDATYGSSQYLYFYTDVSADDHSATLNREHVWPESKASFFQTGGGSDAHHLRPAIQSINSIKSNHTFANVRKDYSGYSSGTVDGVDVIWYSGSDGVVEVRDNIKGDVARILLYVWCRWGEPNLYSDVDESKCPTMDSSDNGDNQTGLRVIESMDILLEWMELDPVDTWEMTRNDRTENFQGNRNVFIDYPELAWLVLGQDIPTGYTTPSGNAPQSCSHSYAGTVTPPTCTEPGFTTYTCSLCGDSYEDDYTAALGHAWNEGVVTTQPTEEKEGVMTYTCTACGETKTEAIPVLEHSHHYTSQVTPPSCTEQGFTTYTCTCGSSYKDNYTAALGHAWDKGTESKKATCTEAGEKVFNCTRCGEKKTQSIPASGHNYEATVTPPTCTEAGYTTYACSACGDSYVSDELPAAGHSYSGGSCVSCGAKEPDAVIVNPFEDVKEADYFYTPVLWAVQQGITTGTSSTTFSPNEACTRGQIVTFLWRACGSPEPATTQNPFTDVKPGEYYYKAVLWAVEQGITAGLSATSFGPNEACTRGQVATFLWRSQGKPAPTSSQSPFSDVKASDYYYEAVLWAVEEGVTQGTGNGRFSPNDSCTRGQIVTFLCRALAE